MEPKRILIVEDEELFASHLEMQLDDFGCEVIGIAKNGKAALSHLRETDADLILMDINIQGSYDGIELADMLTEEFNLPIIFMTSNEDDLTFNRAKRVDPAAFLVKPFSGVQLKRTIELATKSPNEPLLDDASSIEPHHDTQFLFVKKKNEIHKIQKSDIYYLEADGRYTRIYTKGEFFLVRKPLKEVFELMPENSFIRCHRSYIVNMDKVKSVNLEDDLVVLEERSVPLSKREKDRLLDKLNWI